MSFENTISRNDYIGNDTTDTYDYTYKIFDEEHLLVTVRDTENVETTLALTADYTVTGVGDADGGSITLTAGNLADGYAITIRRVVPVTQPTDIRNQGDFYPETHEDAFDRMVMISQQQQDELDRSMKMSETVGGSSFDPTIPSDIFGEENVTIMTNAGGTAFVKGPRADINDPVNYSYLRGYVKYTDTDSPVTLSGASVGKLLLCDCAYGAIQINLPEIINLDWKGPITIRKIDFTDNPVTIFRGGTDTIDRDEYIFISLEKGTSEVILVPNSVVPISGNQNWGIVSKSPTNNFDTKRELQTDNGGEVITVEWPRPYRSDQQLSSTDLKNLTTAYGWNLNGSSSYNSGTFYGGEDLTEVGALTQAYDVLGDLRYVNFGSGTSYLTNSSTAFQMSTGNEPLTIALWAHRDSWVGELRTLMSRLDAAGQNGWRLMTKADGFIYWETFSGGAIPTSELRVGFLNLKSGWHHFCLTRDPGSDYIRFYIDGLRVAEILDSNQTITNGGNLEIGAWGGGQQEWFGRIDEIVYHYNTAYSNNDVAKLYCRTAGIKVMEVIDGDVNPLTTKLDFVSPMEGQLIEYYPYACDDPSIPDYTTDLGAGFINRKSGYRVFKNVIFYEGHMQVIVPVTVATQLNTSMPIQYERQHSLIEHNKPSKWYSTGLSAYYSCAVDLNTNYMQWLVKDTTGPLSVFTKLFNGTPAFASGHKAIWSFSYPTSNNKP